MAELRQNTWETDPLYDQVVAGNIKYVGAPNVYVWGTNTSGQLGLNDILNRSSPAQVPGTTWHQSTTAPTSVRAMTRTDGTLWSVGSGNNGALGQNQPDDTKRSSPVQISGTDWDHTKLWGSEGSFYAFRTNGDLYVWGGNYYGQLGMNEATSTHKSSPIQLPGTWSDLGTTQTLNGAMIRKPNGELYGLGRNSGRLGLNDLGLKSSPTQLPGNWSNRFSCGYSTTYGIKADGTLWSWGYNTYGQLGLNEDNANRPPKSSPIQVGTDVNWATICNVQTSCVAVKTDGSLWCWGRNEFGQLGQGENASQVAARSSPAQVGTDTNWSSTLGHLTAGNDAFMAIKTDGSLWSWGYHKNGQLGQNEHINSHISSPVQIPGSWKNIYMAAGASVWGTRNY
mgnify:CR=1 FL=1